MNQFDNFASSLAQHLKKDDTHYLPHSKSPSKIQIYNEEGNLATLDLTPCDTTPAPVNSFQYFNGIQSVKELLDAYASARKDHVFEDDIIDATKHLSDYAPRFLN